MDGLRWLLLLFGLLAIVGVYVYSRRERAQKDASITMRPQMRVEPSLDGDTTDEEFIEADEHSMSVSSGDGLSEHSISSDAPQKIITLRIVARGDSTFAGDELALCLRGIGMRHGKFGIFHRYDGSDENRVIFSAASLVEPGSFDLTNLKAQAIPGISLFMVLPGPIDGTQAFDLMMVASRALTQSLNAELLDESGSTLSIQRERYLREEIIEYQTANRAD